MFSNPGSKPTSGHKFKFECGKNISNVYYACDVCRVHLCRSCFVLNDHHKGGKSFEFITLWWFFITHLWTPILIHYTYCCHCIRIYTYIVDVYLATCTTVTIYNLNYVLYSIWYQQIVQNNVCSHPHYCSKSTYIFEYPVGIPKHGIFR